ncbi:hypothetical protein [Solibacillus sp. NPDC093137]|uniref:hypothetical protein n=1 Tax=Solibacillus sp. NPDC093137 TaxID=3390678 RepID=UPI003D0544D8
MANQLQILTENFMQTAFKSMVYTAKQEGIELDENQNKVLDLIIANSSTELDTSDIPDFLNIIIKWYEENTEVLKQRCENCGDPFNEDARTAVNTLCEDCREEN